MKALIISKLNYDYILKLVNFPNDGDKYIVDSSINTTNSFGSILSILFAKYGINTYINSVIGNDSYGNKVKEILESNKVDVSYLETSFNEKTNINHKIYNEKTNNYTTIEEKNIKQGITKYKYEFIPEVIIIDSSDYNANMAAINNYPEAKIIYFADKYTKESETYCAKAKYVIANINFASNLTGVVNNLNKSKGIVDLFQKYIDIYKSNLIIKMDNNDLLYCINDEVRIIKNINNNLKNKDYLYYSLLIYFIINNDNIENSIKFTNKVMLNTTNEIDMISNIPNIDIVNEYIKTKEDVFNKEEKVNPVNITKIENKGDNAVEKL